MVLNYIDSENFQFPNNNLCDIIDIDKQNK